jgi:choline kinase
MIDPLRRRSSALRVIILAAGRAERLRPLTDNLPKCLLHVAGKTILSRIIDILAEHGLRQFVIVDGFEGSQLRRAMLNSYPSEWFTFVHNARWQSTNNSYSLLLARYDQVEPMMLLDADIIFEPAAIERMLRAAPPNRLAVRSQGELGDEEIKVVTSWDGRITAIGKDILPVQAIGEAVGITIFSGELSAKLFETLERRCIALGLANEWYEASFAELMQAGEEIYPVDLEERRCIEIDTAEDFENARKMFDH